MEPDDGLEEAVDGQMRVLLTVAAHVGERVARARENQYHQNQTQSETEARQLQDRLDAERAVARAEMSKTQREDWWDRATPTEIAYTYQVACAWSGEDPEAVRTQDKVRTELKNRYDLDVDNLNADPAAVQTAVQRAYDNHATAQGEHRRFSREQTEAHLLLGVANREELLDSLNPTGTIQTEYGPEHRATAPLAANMVPLSQTQNIDGTETITIYRGVPADVDHTINPGDYITTNRQIAADYAGTGNVIQEDVPAAHILDDLDEPGGEEYIYRPPQETPTRNATSERVLENSKNLYDSSERRAAMASELEAKGIEQEIIATRIRADISQAKPAIQATKTNPTNSTKRARKPRNKGRGPQAHRTGLSR